MGEQRVRVKFCGIRLLQDAQLAVDLGVDALGFIFYPPSPRAISITAARELIAQLPPLVTKVGVFVNEAVAEIEFTARMVGLDLVQLSGDETPEMMAELSIPFIKAYRDLPAAGILQQWSDHPQFKGFLADGKAVQSNEANHYGGSGHLAETQLIEGLAREGRLMIAGGLTAETVAGVISAHHPFGVDVSSGIESAPGVKDEKKMREFILAVGG
ncbi:MAG: phosphoribosylanthranilate isomerase [Candidatus Pacebacteria bacterium]|nr:phosphoribosylanthranilate isomerase [Candidatus Paceibacterota bacterium]